MEMKVMTQGDKELLLKDICARMPYGIKGLHRGQVHSIKIMDASGLYPSLQVDGYDAWFPIETFKPYLRPMSSMTWEEKKEFSIFGFEVTDHINANREECQNYQVIEVSNFSGITEITDWLNAHHFDYRGLIEKGLAIEVTENNSPYK